MSELEEESREARDEDAVVKSRQIEKSSQREPASVHGLQTEEDGVRASLPSGPRALGVFGVCGTPPTFSH